MVTGDAAESALKPAALNVKAAATYLGTTPQMLRNLIRDKRIPATDISSGTGQRPYYVLRVVDLDAFLAKPWAK